MYKTVHQANIRNSYLPYGLRVRRRRCERRLGKAPDVPKTSGADLKSFGRGRLPNFGAIARACRTSDSLFSRTRLYGRLGEVGAAHFPSRGVRKLAEESSIRSKAQPSLACAL
eukprot:scaffold1147_cov250-Pinguiococcus_pyrenoidosus.AAC.15